METKSINKECRGIWDNKVIAMVGNWEPMFHRIRGGYGFTNERERYDKEHCEDMAKKLADEGINFVVMHYYKGIGFEREKPDMEDTKRFIEYCHKYNILVGTYTQFGTFFNETFPDEHQNAMDYCQRDQFGQPGLYSEFYFSYHRNRVCASSDKFMEFLKEVIRYSVEYVGTDMVYFDNIGQVPCYCHKCKKTFPEFIAQKYPTEKQRLEKFGFSKLDAIQIPTGIYWRPIHCMDVISDQLVQEWVKFRCQQLDDALVGMKNFIDTLNRKVPMAINPPVLYGDNAPLAYGTDWIKLMETTQMFYCEDGNVTQTTDDGRLISQHRCYKTARIRNNSCMRFHTPWTVTGSIEPELIAISEAAVFNNGNLGNVKCYGNISTSLQPSQKQYIKYFRDHQSDYAGVEQLSEVAVYKNFESLAWSWLETWPQLTIVEQLLIQSGTQFSYVVNDELNELENYKTLVIPEMSCLSKQQAQKIVAFVKAGGGLLVTGQSGSRNLSYRRYETNLLAELLGRKLENISATTFVAVGAGAGGDKEYDSESLQKFSQRWQFGNGRICWIPQAVMAHPLDPKLPELIHTMIHGNTYWDVPANWQEILDGLDWTLVNGRWVPMETPSTVVPQVSKSADGDRLLLHLVNYDKNRKINNTSINISRDLITPDKVMWRTPENQKLQELKFKESKKGIEFKLPVWKIHGTIVLTRT